MKIAALIIIFYLFVNATFSQNCKILLLRPSVSQVYKEEIANKGERIDLAGINYSISKNYFPGSENYSLAQPLVFEKNTTPVKCTTSYYLSLPDSAVRLIEYTWNGTEKNVADLQQIVEQQKNAISKFLGFEGVSSTEVHDDWTQTSTIWDNGNIHVKEFLVIGSRTYRARILVSWK